MRPALVVLLCHDRSRGTGFMSVARVAMQVDVAARSGKGFW